jgi:hypothetical protein
MNEVSTEFCKIALIFALAECCWLRMRGFATLSLTFSGGPADAPHPLRLRSLRRDEKRGARDDKAFLGFEIVN